MRVSALIKEGKHYPSFWNRLWHFRVWPLMWPFMVPTRFTISDLRVRVKVLGEWIDPFYKGDDKGAEHCALVFRHGVETSNIGLYEQVNKAGGLAWGLPKKTENKKTFHPNSYRIGFSFKGWQYLYGYRKGVHSENVANGIVGARAECDFPLRLAYFLGPYIGGVETGQFDTRISYTIKFHSFKPCFYFSEAWLWFRKLIKSKR